MPRGQLVLLGRLDAPSGRRPAQAPAPAWARRCWSAPVPAVSSRSTASPTRSRSPLAVSAGATNVHQVGHHPAGRRQLVGHRVDEVVPEPEPARAPGRGAQDDRGRRGRGPPVLPLGDRRCRRGPGSVPRRGRCARTSWATSGDPHLDRGVLRGEPGVEVDHAAVEHGPGAEQTGRPARRSPPASRARRPDPPRATRPHLGAVAGIPRVAALPERRVHAHRHQHRQPDPDPVEGATPSSSAARTRARGSAQVSCSSSMSP